LATENTCPHFKTQPFSRPYSDELVQGAFKYVTWSIYRAS